MGRKQFNIQELNVKDLNRAKLPGNRGVKPPGNRGVKPPGNRSK